MTFMRRILLLSAAVLLGLASQASACTGCTPTRYAVLPGAGLIFAPWIGLILPILTGILERPLYTLAGFKTQTVWYSIQANFLAMWVANTLGTYILMSMPGAVAAAWIEFVAALILISLIAAAPKWFWFRRVPREHGATTAYWVFFVASVASGLACASLMVWMSLFGTDLPSWAAKVSDVQPIAILASVFLAICVYVSAFARARRAKRPGADPIRGFEVLPTNSSIPVARPVDT
jgi:hypothetical protein